MFDPNTRILIVDDMGAMRKVLAKMVKDLGFTDLFESEDGDTAWHTLSTASPTIDLVISDWNMPNCSGYDLLVRVRADIRFKNMPFLLVTGESEEEQISSAMAAGADGYVVKPFDTSVLNEMINNIYRKKAA